MRLLPAELAHDLAVGVMRSGLVPRLMLSDDPRLRCCVFGRELVAPLGLAAGFDKNAVAIRSLSRLGFAALELGTVTPRGQRGNPKPRLFRLPRERALINRMGFNNDGAERVAARLRAYRARQAARPTRDAPLIGVNLGKNRDTVDAAADYAAGAKLFAPLADYLVVNVSSPNTPGLRALQERESLAAVLARVQAAIAETRVAPSPPLLIKIAPELGEQELRDVVEVALALRLSGIIASNTTLARTQPLAGRHREEHGGLSGRPLFVAATEQLRALRRLSGGKLLLIGVGGVSSGADVYAKIRAGASFVQVYTAFVYEGPEVLARWMRELGELLARDGFACVADAVGADETSAPR